MELAWLGTARLSWRRLRSLLAGLPPDSALGRAGPGQGWTVTDYLLADLFDVLAAGNWQRGNAGAPAHKRSRYPEPRRRPGDSGPTRVPAEDLAARLVEFHERAAAEGGD